MDSTPRGGVSCPLCQVFLHRLSVGLGNRSAIQRLSSHSSGVWLGRVIPYVIAVTHSPVLMVSGLMEMKQEPELFDVLTRTSDSIWKPGVPALVLPTANMGSPSVSQFLLVRMPPHLSCGETGRLLAAEFSTAPPRPCFPTGGALGGCGGDFDSLVEEGSVGSPLASSLASFLLFFAVGPSGAAQSPQFHRSCPRPKSWVRVSTCQGAREAFQSGVCLPTEILLLKEVSHVNCKTVHAARRGSMKLRLMYFEYLSDSSRPLLFCQVCPLRKCSCLSLQTTHTCIELHTRA